MKIYKFDEIDSTNDFAMKNLDHYEQYTVVQALYQTKGRGQSGCMWESEAKQNLTFSIVLRPNFLSIENQFYLTKCIAISLVDYFHHKLPQKNIHIKWPNDIYVENKKICGILINNKIVGEKYDAAIVGIGININQIKFGNNIPNPTSLSLLTQTTHDIDVELASVVRFIKHHYLLFSENHYLSYDSVYLDNLLYYNEFCLFETNENKQILARIDNVSKYGHLILQTKEGEYMTFDIKQIKLLGKA